MSYLQFKKGWEKLKGAPCKVEVLKLMLAGNTDAEIAKSRNRAPGTIRKQISQIYRDFGIESEFPGDQPQRYKLKDLFRQHRPELVAEYDYTVTSQVSEEGGQENQSSKSLAISSSRKDEGLILSAIPILEEMSRGNSIPIASSNKGEELMLMATKILEELDVNQVFKVKKNSQSTRYHLKNPPNGWNRYLLIFFQQEESLSISIAQDILEPYLLTLKYWEYVKYSEIEVDSYIAGRFLVLPTKKDIFLDSLLPNYWNVLEIVRQTVGTFYLNQVEEIPYKRHSLYKFSSKPLPRIILDEFNPNTLSRSDSYLILDEDKRFSKNYQVYISSSTILQEFLTYFGQILFNTFVDDVPF
jgi:hypothetical protein